MIKRKKKKCKECNKETFLFSKGLCKQCAVKGYARRRKESRAEIREFFKLFSNKKGKCEITGNNIPKIKAVNICHIFPKRTYKSIATDRDNVIIMESYLHPIMDLYLDSMDMEGLAQTQPEIVDLICKRFGVLKERIKEKDKRLYNEIKNYVTNRDRG